MYLTICAAVIAAAAALIYLYVTRPAAPRRCPDPGCLCTAGPAELHGLGTDEHPYVARRSRRGRRRG